MQKGASDSPFHIAVSWEAARYRNSRYEGHFEGITPEVGLRFEAFSFGARLPGYRLTRNGLPSSGIGDLTLLMQQDLWRSRSSGDVIGWRAVVALPTGDSNHDLGMGHVMLMPGAFARLAWNQLETLLVVEFARAVMSESGHHHRHDADYFPIVQPMNTSEFSAAIQLEYALVAGLGLRARLQSAIPVADTNGQTRTIVGLGVSQRRQDVATYLEWQTPVQGAPFLARLSGGLAFWF